MKNEKGITLVALIITIVVLFLLTGVGITSGTKSINNMKLKSFYAKLEIVQEAVEKISETNESYKDSNQNNIELVNQGAEPTSAQNTILQEALNESDLSRYNFRYFTSDQVENVLDISGVDLNLLIDFGNKKVVSEEPLVINNVKYYTLQSTKYSESYDPSKNQTNLNLNFAVSKYGSNSYKIKVTINNVGNIKNGVLKYRKNSADDYWKVADDNEIIVKKIGDYDINYTDDFGNSVQKIIRLDKNSSDDVYITEIE